MTTKLDPHSHKREMIGEVSVDSGLIAIGDPCYLRDLDTENFHEGFEEAHMEDDPTLYRLFGGFTQTANGMAVVLHTPGDDSYPLFIERDSHGHIKYLVLALCNCEDGGDDAKSPTTAFYRALVDWAQKYQEATDGNT